MPASTSLPGRKSLLWRLAVPTCIVVAIVVTAVGAFMPAAVVDAAGNQVALNGAGEYTGG